jgi:hypothetical protein
MQGATAMRTVILLTLALLVQAASDRAQAATERGYMLLAQIIPSCGEQANVWYLQYIGLKCNTPNPPQRDRCQLLMNNICDLAEKKRCEGARPYCLKKR